MSGITDRIAKVLERQPVEAIYDDDSDYLTIQSARRLAAVLIAELGLTEEEGTDFTGGGLVRYVTPWEPAS